MSNSELRATFALFDVDKSGTIDQQEWLAIFRKIAVSEADALDRFKEFDTNNDGVIDLDEFCSKWEDVRRLIKNQTTGS